MADEIPNPHPTLAAPPADESQKPFTEKDETPEPPSNKQEPTPEPPLRASQSSSMEPEKENPSPSEPVVVDSEPIVTTQKEETFTEVVTEVPDVKDATLVVEKQETLSKTVAEASDLKDKEKEVLFADNSVELKSKEGDKEKKIPQSLVSFKEESNKVADLSDSERKALQEFRQLVQDALDSNQLVYPKKPSSDTTTATEPPNSESKIEENPVKEAEEVAKEAPKAEAFVEEVSIWGVPLLKDDRSDVILLKFLRARDFKVKDAFVMLRNTLSWRKEFGIDGLLDEDLGDDLDKVVFMHGYDKEGHSVCYNVFGEFQNKELYHKTFSDDEKRTKFLRWRIKFLERSIRKLDFSPGGVCSIFQVNDLKNSPGPGKRDLRLATRHALQLLQDNYPEFVAKQVFINVPWWYLAFYTMISPFLTQRTKSKFVFAGPQKSPETLFKYISPEHVPIQYGGLSVDDCDCNPEFSVSDPVTEVNIKPGTKQIVEIIIYEKCVIVWELRVVGWEVSYSAEFAPNTEGAYSIIIQKPVKMAPNDEPVVPNSFKVAELGKILLTINNPTSKRKKLLYRFNIKPISD